MKKVLLITIGIISILIGISIILLIKPFDKNIHEVFDSETGELIPDNYSNIYQFHYGNLPIKYTIKDIGGCNDSQTDQFKRALQIIEDETNKTLFFEETSSMNETDIIVECVNRTYLETSFSKCKPYLYNYLIHSRFSVFDDGVLNTSNEKFINISFINKTKPIMIYEVCYIDLQKIRNIGINTEKNILGEGGILNHQENIIIKGIINLYVENVDDLYSYPSKDIHEILHALGFGHIVEANYSQMTWSNKEDYKQYEIFENDIMFPYLSGQKLNQKYIDCLKYIYSNGEKGYCWDINQIFYDEDLCEEGFFSAINAPYCCPELNMLINNEGYCE